MTTRRNIIAGALIFVSLAISPAQAQTQDKPTEIRIGTQKGGFFPAVRQRHTVEDAFKPLGIAIKWVDFQLGPPLLEAINVGAVDFGFVGDSPPIFAQAGGARIRYVAAVKSDGNNQAIIVPKDSPIKTVADLKGKRVVPVDDEAVRSQQAIADRFAKLGLIPKPVNVSDIIWKWSPGS